MAYLTIYPTPTDADCELVHDSGLVVRGVPGNDKNGRACQTFNVPDGTTDRWGCSLSAEAEGKLPFKVRGLLIQTHNDVGELIWLFMFDDVVLQDVPLPPPVPAPVPPQQPETPIGIINAVYETGLYDLSTKEGCGEFTEKCCDELHDNDSKQWGHVRKMEGQNQYNGHAVDAIQLLMKSGETKTGIYDIIYSSESNDAKPAFNRAGDARPDLWYYPA